MKAEIVSIGSELVLGKIVDTNTAYISDRLAGIGIDVRYHTAVGDIEEDLCSILGIACGRAEFVVVTGGLGPTRDDLTRQAVAKFCGVDLVLDQESLEHIQAMFRKRHREMQPANRVQALFPKGATVIRNEVGTAPGFCIAHGKSEIMTMPGVPSEMKKMFEEWVLPHIKAKAPDLGVVLTRDVRSFGVPEAEIGEKLHDLMDPNRNPFVATQASEGVITMRIIARAKSAEEGEKVLSETATEIRRRIGEGVFGEGRGGLEIGVSGALMKKGLRLAVAESCTGGLIGHWLTNVPGISKHLLEDVVAYSNRAKTDILGVPAAMIEKAGAVSDEVARAMAEGVRRRSGADAGLSVTGIAGPGGGSEKKPVGLVFAAVSSVAGTVCKEFHLWGDREQIKDRAAKFALDFLRRELEKIGG